MKADQSIRALLLASVAMIGTACGAPESQAWEEQVQMADGRTLTVNQERFYERVFTGEGVGNVPREGRLTLRLPELSATEILWQGDLHPQSIGVSDGVLYLIGYPFTGREMSKYGNPNPPYVCFRYRDGEWIRLPLAEVPRLLWSVNLWLDDLPKKDRSPISLADKRADLRRPSRAWQERIDPALHL